MTILGLFFRHPVVPREIEGPVGNLEVPIVSEQDWQKMVEGGLELMSTTVTHVRHERRIWGKDSRGIYRRGRVKPRTLCEEQKTDLAHDLATIVEGSR